MRTYVIAAGIIGILFAGGTAVQAEDAPKKMEVHKMPAPTTPEKEHQWLQQFVGEWESEGEINMEPGKPPMKCTGTETARALGEFWVVSDIKGTFMDQPMSGIFTIGYDPEKKKFVGSWIDSMSSYMWKYKGTLNSASNMLTLESEGPCPMAGGEIRKVKEVMEVKSKDHRVMTSSVEVEDGKWTKMATMHIRRKM